MLEMIEYERFNVPAPQRTARADKALAQVLDAYMALGVDVQPLVPRSVWRWYQSRNSLDFR